MNTTIRTVERPPQQASEQPPLLIMLHGYGSNEQDLFGLADHLDPRLHIVSARAILMLGAGAYAWYHLSGVPGNLIPDDETREQSLAVLQQFVPAVIERTGANPQQVFLLGFSQGAVMSLGIGMTRPELATGGILAFSGYLNQSDVPATPPPAFSDLHILIEHGTDDNIIPISAGRASRDALQALPVHLTYEEYRIAHSIHPNGLLLAQRWLSERLAATAAADD